jgi:hypothetical protein
LDQKEADLWLWRWIRVKKKTEKNEVYLWMAVEIKKISMSLIFYLITEVNGIKSESNWNNQKVQMR